MWSRLDDDEILFLATNILSQRYIFLGTKPFKILYTIFRGIHLVEFKRKNCGSTYSYPQTHPFWNHVFIAIYVLRMSWKVSSTGDYMN